MIVIEDSTLDSLLADIKEMNRLRELSDQELLKEWFRSESTEDNLLVLEIIKRWQPEIFGDEEQNSNVPS